LQISSQVGVARSRRNSRPQKNPDNRCGGSAILEWAVIRWVSEARLRNFPKGIRPTKVSDTLLFASVAYGTDPRIFLSRENDRSLENHKRFAGWRAQLLDCQRRPDRRPRSRPASQRRAATGCALADDGFWRPDVRVPFQTDDGETVLMHYTGLVQQTDVFKQAAEANKSTEWGDQYMRLAMRFDTGAERYGWLNTSLFVAKGRLLGTGSIEYAVYRLT
jgi:Protein of unknown function (DUF3237)